MTVKLNDTTARSISWEEASPRAKDRWDEHHYDGHHYTSPGDLLSIEMCPKCPLSKCVWPSMACPIKRRLAAERKEKKIREEFQQRVESKEVRQLEFLNRMLSKTREVVG